MGGITIEELGMKFVDACMKLYWGPCWYPVLFAIGLIATLIWGRKKSSMIFIGCSAVLYTRTPLADLIRSEAASCRIFRPDMFCPLIL